MAAELADGFARALLRASVPTIDLDAPHRRWPLMPAHHALAALAAYLVLVAVGVAMKRSDAAKRGGSEVAAKRGGSEPAAKAVPLSLGAMLADPMKSAMVVYNAAQVVLSAWIAYSAVAAAWRTLGGRLVCNAFDQGETEVASVVWLFYFSKCIDFIDTIFIIARRKWQQLSFLHTYHHASIFITYWWVASAAPHGDLWVPILLNAVVHTTMYFYYLMSTLGRPPSWGQRLTELQMTQFAIMLVHGVAMVMGDCPYPSRVTWAYLGYIAFMLALFANFYLRKHCCGGKRASSAAAIAGAASKHDDDADAAIAPASERKAAATSAGSRRRPGTPKS